MGGQQKVRQLRSKVSFFAPPFTLVSMFYFLTSFLSVIFVASTVSASDCHCKDIPPVFTADCCLGSGGDLRIDNGAVHCVFNDYSTFGGFNRCCDSYWGIARCVLSPRPELDEFMQRLENEQSSTNEDTQHPAEQLPPPIPLPQKQQQQPVEDGDEEKAEGEHEQQQQQQQVQQSPPSSPPPSPELQQQQQRPQVPPPIPNALPPVRK